MQTFPDANIFISNYTSFLPATAPVHEEQEGEITVFSQASDICETWALNQKQIQGQISLFLAMQDSSLS